MSLKGSQDCISFLLLDFQIGLARDDDDDFYWSDGSDIDFTAWQAGEPNNGGSSGKNENYKLWRYLINVIYSEDSKTSNE